MNTPVQHYQIRRYNILVKREDLAGTSPGPSFSKTRGLRIHMQKLKEQGIQTVGYVETPISMAGWGVAEVGYQLGMKVIIFDPQYINTKYEAYSTHEYHRQQWKKFGVEVIPVPAGRASINMHRAKKILAEIPHSVLLPLGLPFPETIEETALQANQVYSQYSVKTMIVPVGSGTICAGVMKASPPNISIYGILCRTGSIPHKKALIYTKADMAPGELIFPKLELVDLGYNYTQREDFPAPFPCHPYYDRKAWKWTAENIDKLEPPVMFWNIGS